MIGSQMNVVCDPFDTKKTRFKKFLDVWVKHSNRYDEMFFLGDFNIDVSADKYKDKVFKELY